MHNDSDGQRRMAMIALCKDVLVTRLIYGPLTARMPGEWGQFGSASLG